MHICKCKWLQLSLSFSVRKLFLDQSIKLFLSISSENYLLGKEKFNYILKHFLTVLPKDSTVRILTLYLSHVIILGNIFTVLWKWLPCIVFLGFFYCITVCKKTITFYNVSLLWLGLTDGAWKKQGGFS